MSTQNHILDYIEPASRGSRFVNHLVDSIVFLGVVFVISFVLDVVFDSDFMYYPLAILYYTLMEANGGRTIGKFFTGTIAVMEDGEPLSTKAAFTRSVCRIIPFEAFSIFRESMLCWHDTIPGSVVVNLDEYEEFMSGQFDEFEE